MHLVVTVNCYHYNVFINQPFFPLCFYLVNCWDFFGVSRLAQLLCKQWIDIRFNWRADWRWCTGQVCYSEFEISLIAKQWCVVLFKITLFKHSSVCFSLNPLNLRTRMKFLWYAVEVVMLGCNVNTPGKLSVFRYVIRKQRELGQVFHSCGFVFVCLLWLVVFL